MRDQHGRWTDGYRHNIGCCLIEEAEAWGIMQGLHLAIRLGVWNIVVESDSKSTIGLLQGANRVHGYLHNIITSCKGLAKRFTTLEFRHVYREQNRVADTLTKQALPQPLGLIILEEALYELRDMVREDQMGAKFNRRISVRVND